MSGDTTNALAASTAMGWARMFRAHVLHQPAYGAVGVQTDPQTGDDHDGSVDDAHVATTPQPGQGRRDPMIPQGLLHGGVVVLARPDMLAARCGGSSSTPYVM